MKKKKKKEPIIVGLFHEMTFDGRHCYKHQPKGKELIIAVHENRKIALKILREKVNNPDTLSR